MLSSRHFIAPPFDAIISPRLFFMLLLILYADVAAAMPDAASMPLRYCHFRYADFHAAYADFAACFSSATADYYAITPSAIAAFMPPLFFATLAIIFA